MITSGGKRKPANPDCGDRARLGRRRISTACPTSSSTDATAPVDLVGQPDADPEVLPSIAVWRSVRAGGDTKTRKSRRTLALPTRCITALEAHRVYQDAARKLAGHTWQEHNLVFASAVGTELDAHNV